MATVKYHNTEDNSATVRGLARTLHVEYDGSQYRIYQFARIDESGYDKVREWGRYNDYSSAIEEAKGKADRQYG